MNNSPLPYTEKRKEKPLVFYKSNTSIFPIVIFFLATCVAFPQTISAQGTKNLAGDSALPPGSSTLYPAEIFISRLDTIHSRLNRISNFSSRGFDTKEIDRALPEIAENLQVINENLSLYSSVQDTKNLQMFQILLDDMKDELNEWRTSLSGYNKELIKMNAEISAFTRDSLMRKFIEDSTYSRLYLAPLNQLKEKWILANNSTTNNLAKINQLQASVSNYYFEVVDLQIKVRRALRNIGRKSFNKEYDYLWDAGDTPTTNAQLSQLAIKSYQGQKKIFQYYFQQAWDTHFWLIVLGIAFFLWVSRNFKRVEMEGITLASPNLNFRYLKKFPVLATLIVLFNLVPFFDLHPPSAYVQLIEFFMLITLTIFFAKNWPRKLFFYWAVIAMLFILFSLTSAVLIPGKGFRSWLLFLNVSAVIFGIFFIARFKKDLALSRIVKPVSWIYLILNILAILCNMYGRLSLAKLFSIAAIFGLTQIIGLSAFVRIIKEAIQLQIESSKKRGGIISRIRYENIHKELGLVLIIISSFTWIVIFAINLNIYDILYRIVNRQLNKPRIIGSTSFQLGNILLFVVILYVSNLLQKYIGQLFDYSDDNFLPVQGVKKGSKLVMTRLILIVIGFLLAIAASGLPLDKITIVLGALSVGIGLGLQSIVNNFVSGIILIFERPFEIGDYVELDNKKGIIRDIGIRSSKLLSQDGAEIIMPNGDLLSGRVVNWTSRNNHVRIELTVNIEAGANIEQIRKILLEALNKNPEVLEAVRPEILLKSISNSALGLSILVWIKNVNRDVSIKSELLTIVYTTLLNNSVKII